jgi:hypothetical protein
LLLRDDNMMLVAAVLQEDLCNFVDKLCLNLCSNLQILRDWTIGNVVFCEVSCALNGQQFDTQRFIL